MAKLRIGPFSEVHFSKLEQRLAAVGATFAKFEEPVHLDRYNQKMQDRDPLTLINPVYSGNSPEYLFLEIEKADIFHIRQDLNDLGYTLQESDDDLAEEFYCRHCDYHADSAGICPAHGKELLTYSDWLTFKNKPTLTKAVVSFLLIAVFLILIFAAVF